jgi:hypothetical protein
MRSRSPVAAARHQFLDRVVTRPQFLLIADGPVQPTPQEPPPHGRDRAVEHTGQGQVGPAGQAHIQFEVAARGRVHEQGGLAVLGHQAAQMRQRGFLGLAHVGEQCTGGADGQRQLLAAEAGQITGAELLAQGAARRIQLEMPGRAVAPGTLHTRFARRRRWRVVGYQDFGRPQPFQFGVQRLDPCHLHDTKASGGQIQPGQPKAASPAADAGEQGFAALLQQGIVGDRARRDHAHHLALHGSLGLARLAALLADGHRLAGAHEALQVGVERHGRHARHRDRRTRRGAALSQRDVEQGRRAARIVIEHLVEIAHAIEQQHVGVLSLDAQVLLHHGGVLGQIGGARHRRVEG